MAERLKERLLDTERLADIVAGPDAYRDLPRLIQAVQARGQPLLRAQYCGLFYPRYSSPQGAITVAALHQRRWPDLARRAVALA